MSHQSNRRDFLKTSAAAASTAWWVGHSLTPAFAQSRANIENINFACVGIEGKGSSDSADAGKSGNVVAVCDIDERKLEKAAVRFPNAKTFVDYREMYAEMGDKFDAVTVSTPDHSHAPASVGAMKLGKGCFCQKPLTWSVHEAKVMKDLAAEKGIATQMGNQGTSNNGVREAVEIVRAGLLGEIKEIHVWTNRPIWPQGTGRPTEEKEVPKGLHWDLFIGPAQMRPYADVYHPFKWRGWVDFGTGALGDMACHTANMAVMAADLFDPTWIEADSDGIFEGETYPSRAKITFQFPERDRGDGQGKWPAAKMYWYDGGNLPAQNLVPDAKYSASGSIIVGSEFTIFSPDDYGAEFAITKTGTSEAIYKTPGFKGKKVDGSDIAVSGNSFKKPEPSLPRSPGHFAEYANAIKGGDKAMSDFSYAARLTGTILLGNVAMRAGEKVNWDAAKFTTGDAAHDKFLHRDYREGWTL